MATRGKVRIRLRAMTIFRMDSIDAPEFAIAASFATESTIWRHSRYESVPFAPRRPYSSIFMGGPISVQDYGSSVITEARGRCEQSFSTM